MVSVIDSYSFSPPQNPHVDTTVFQTRVSLGLGVGINYGGFGAQANYLFGNNFRISAGYGTNLVKMNYSLGISYRFLSKSTFCPVLSYAYGYHKTVYDRENVEKSTSYNGSSIGLGLEIWNNQRDSYFLINAFLPIETINNIKSNTIENSSKFYQLLNSNPIVFSVGYHLAIKSSKAK